MLRTRVYERTYVLLKYDPRLKYPLCYDPQVLQSVVINLDRKVTQQEKEIIDLKGKSIRDNILIHNLTEENEDLFNRVPRLIKEHIQLDDINIIGIQRNGARFQGNTRPRAITGNLTISIDLDRTL